MTAPSAHSIPDDRTLVRAFLDGDERAFRTLYARHTPRLRMIVTRMLGPREADVDDVMQETWIAGCRGMHAFNGTARFATWLTTIGIRSVQNRLRMSTWREADLPEEIVAPAAPPAATVIDLERAIARLPDHQRAVVVLHDIEGFTHEEIGAQLGVAEGTSKATLHRARAALRCMLNDGVFHD